jgi:hypothetical protein
MYSIKMILNTRLARMYERGINQDPLKPEGEGSKHWDRQLDKKVNDAHLIKDKNGKPIPNHYEPGYVPIDSTRAKIYDMKTFMAYKYWAGRFADWMKETGKPMRYAKAADAMKYVPEFLEAEKSRMASENQSAWTYDLERSALVKAFQIPKEMTELGSKFLPKSPVRHYGDIKQHRGPNNPNDRLDQKKWAPLFLVAGCFGARHGELEALRPEMLCFKADKTPYLHIIGKGGRHRKAVLHGTPETIRNAISIIQSTPKGQPVFPKVPQNMDSHRFRRDYANNVYWQYARKEQDVPKDERTTRTLISKDGVVSIEWFDRKAIYKVSDVLGHNRPGVSIENYMYHGYYGSGKD